MKMRAFAPFVFLFLIAFVVGCNNAASVTGTIKLPDGSPLTKTKILFENDATSVVGITDANGRYDLFTLNEGDGVAPGKYRGFIVKSAPTSNFLALGAAREPDIFAQKYTNVSSSGLSFEVKAGEKKTYDIALDAK